MIYLSLYLPLFASLFLGNVWNLCTNYKHTDKDRANLLKNTFQAKLNSFKSAEEKKFVEVNVLPRKTLQTWNYVTIKNLKGKEYKSYFWPDGSAWDYSNFKEPSA